MAAIVRRRGASVPELLERGPGAGIRSLDLPGLHRFRPPPLAPQRDPRAGRRGNRRARFGGSKLSHDDHFDRNSEAVFLQIVCVILRRNSVNHKTNYGLFYYYNKL